MVFRLLPYKNSGTAQPPRALALHQFELITQTFCWGNINDPDVFLDHTIKQMVAAFRFRQMFAEVAGKLVALGEMEKAEILLDLAQNTFPSNKISYDYFSADMARVYYQLGADSKADTLVDDIYQSSKQSLVYYLQGQMLNQNTLGNDAQLHAYLMQEMIRLSGKYNTNLSKKLQADFETLF
jgi:hypothetical protein